jgi:hypothetical protein
MSADLLAVPRKPWPCYEDDEIAAVDAVLRSGRVNYWTGDECRQFEGEFAASCGVPHAIALANGTVALELALKVLDIGSGAEVIVTPRSFIASVSCVIACGADPVFVDVELDSQNIAADTIEPALTERTRAIIAVHLAGWPCDMAPILRLARERGIKVIEDCAQAHGARYAGQPVGSFGDVAAFSFCQDKIITTCGEGGMLTTQDRDLWRKAWEFKDHGKSFDAVYKAEHPPGFRWLHESFGTNWRMTEVQGAVGRLQLRKLARWVERRRRNAAILTETLSQFPGLTLPAPPENTYHAYYKYYAFIEPAALQPGWSRERVITELNAEGVPCLAGSCGEIYRERAFEGHPSRPAVRLPNARRLEETSLMFLVHPTLDDVDMRNMAAASARVLRRALMG